MKAWLQLASRLINLQALFALILARTPLGSALRRVPFLEAAYNRRALMRHDQSHRLCGIYSSYAQALAGVPHGRLCGWNNEAAAAIWSDCINPVRPEFALAESATWPTGGYTTTII